MIETKTKMMEAELIKLIETKLLEANIKNPCPISESGYVVVNGKCIYFESLNMNRTNAKQNCLSKMKDYGFGQLFEPKSKSMNDLVANKVNTTFGDDWPLPFIGFNDIAIENTFVFESDNSPVLSAFSPSWMTHWSHRRNQRNRRNRRIRDMFT